MVFRVQMQTSLHCYTLFLSLALSNSQDWNTKFVYKSDIGTVLGSATFKGSLSFRGDKMFQIKTKN